MTDKQAAIEHDCKLALTYIYGVAENDGDELLAEATEKLEAALQSKPVDVDKDFEAREAQRILEDMEHERSVCFYDHHQNRYSMSIPMKHLGFMLMLLSRAINPPQSPVTKEAEK